MSRVERVAAHVGQIHALLQRIINECDAAQTEVFDYLYMSDAANEQSEKLKTENAKLRELVRDMFEEIEAGGFDPMVERHGKNTVYYEEDPSWRVKIRERVRKLGI